jgi:hypothetical protein
MKKHLQQLLSKITMKVVLNVKEPWHTTNQIIISIRKKERKTRRHWSYAAEVN